MKYKRLIKNLLDTILTNKTLMSSKEKNEKLNEIENESENENENENENEDEDEDDNLNEDEYENLNDNLDKIIDKSKTFEDQIESLKKLEDLKEYLPYKNYDDKELKSKYFKIELAGMSNEIDKKLFEQIFGHTLIKLADKLINATNKEENQIIVKNVNKNKDKLLERDDFDDWVFQPNDQRINLLDTMKLILNLNEDQLDLF